MVSFTPIMTRYQKEMERTLPLRTLLSKNMESCSAWLVRQKYGEKIHHFYRLVLKTFNRHPSETNETYCEHLWFTTKTSLRFAAVGIILFTHGIFPFFFTRTASKQIERIYIIMRSRIPLQRREVIETQYEI